jgi:hypothetical protein
VLAHYLSSQALGFSALRLGLALATLLAFALVWRRPRPWVALAVVLALHMAAWLAYRAIRPSSTRRSGTGARSRSGTPPWR